MNRNLNHVKHPTRATILTRKRNEADDRLFARSKLSPKAQLALIAKRRGESKRERARLLAV